MKIEGKTVWVTDAGGALGSALVRALAEADNFVIVSGVDGPALQGLMTRSRGAVAALAPAVPGRSADGVVAPIAERLAGHFGSRLAEFTDRLDIVVCGGAAAGVLSEGGLDCAQAVMERELLLPMRLIEVALPLLRRGRNPYLVCLCGVPAEGGSADVVGAAGVALAGFARSLTGPWPGAVAVSIVQLGRENGDPERAAGAILAGMARRRAVIRVGRPAGALDALSGRWRALSSGLNRSSGVAW